MARSLKSLYKYYSSLKDRYYYKLRETGGIVKMITTNGNIAKITVYPIGVKEKHHKLPTRWEQLGWAPPYAFVFYLPKTHVQNLKIGQIVDSQVIDEWLDLQL